MKKIKFNHLAIIGMVVAMATVAFTAPKASILWFETTPEGVIDKDSSYDSPPSECQGTTDYCAVAFQESDLINGKPPIDNVEDDTNNLIADQRLMD